MSNNGQEILDKIKEQNIQPKKRWEFLFKNYLLWFIFILSIVFGSLASAVTIFMIRHSVWSNLGPNFDPLHRLWLNLPLFWLIILLLFWLLAWYDFKNTKHGYRYHPALILLFNIFLSVIFGLVVYQVGIGQKLEDSFFRRVPFYQQMFKRGGRMMTEPGNGHLPGVVKYITADKVVVEDFSGRIFEISTSTDQFQVGQRVVLFGHLDSDNNFSCSRINPWFRPHNRPPALFW